FFRFPESGFLPASNQAQSEKIRKNQKPGFLLPGFCDVSLLIFERNLIFFILIFAGGIRERKEESSASGPRLEGAIFLCLGNLHLFI
ncbi:hypothetical protein, partial [uncultured Dubosiella sp.]|uniref:hypothetical protein n=1 Tax=uncultured Dubosiella sp. TaxID=1937011 RepID=UPI0027295957